MEKLLKAELGCSTVTSCGGGGGGCISSGSVYKVDDKQVFVKTNPKAGSRLMFDGEYASLEKINETKTIKAPKPIKVFGKGDESFLVMEYLDMSSLRKHAASLGTKLANMHLHNTRLKETANRNENFIGKKCEYVDSFGFDLPTCCGFIPMKNDWMNDWVQFYANNRLLPQINQIVETRGDRDLRDLWPQVERNIPKLFPSDLEIVPSLLHGDLWGGNAAELTDQPCVFDPACSYGHSEFELAISNMFGGFPTAFFASYHALIPKSPGFEKRQRLYQLFHYLNHWNHFGGGYRGSSISIMKELAKL